MTNAPLASVVRHIRGLAAPPPSSLPSDGVLLRTFLAHADQVAFAAIVQRHGPLVLAVCRRVLQNVHDAEDAFQATFILLAQSAPAIRKQESLASWLHGVAYRTARTARRAAARRRRHEGEAKPMRETSPGWEAAWREVQTVLDEEVQRLPDIYRTAFILCCLENLSRSEAAAAAGIKEATVGSRLTKARKLLQQALTRRGVSLSAVFAAALLSQGTAPAALPRTFVSATVEAVTRLAANNGGTVGIASPRIADLVKGAQKAMFFAKMKTATLILLTLTLCAAAGLGAVRHTSRSSNPSEQARPAQDTTAPERSSAPEKPRPEAGEQITLKGRVLDPAGKPLAGARLFLSTCTPGQPKDSPWTPGGFKAVERAVSNKDGRFHFSMPKAEFERSDYWEQSRLMAVASGFGPDLVMIHKGLQTDGLTLRLVKDLPLNGRVLDADGKPVAGAKVRVSSLSAYAAENIDSVVDNVRTGIYSGEARHGGEAGICGGDKFWIGALPGQPREVTTRADGRFRITGVGRERHVRLHVEGPGIHHGYLVAVTRRMEPLVSPRTSIGTLKLYGATFDYIAAAARPIRGVVRDGITGKPVSGVRVSAENSTFTALTDKEGRFEILGYPKSPRYTVSVTPPEGQSYFARYNVFDDAPGFDPLRVTIYILPGIPLQGRVVEKGTKKPVAGARVAYYPVMPNPFAVHMAYNPFEGPASTTTAADGSFHLAVLAGPGVVGVKCASGHPYMPALITRKEMDDFFKDKGIHPGSSAQAILVQQGANGMSVIGQTHYQSLALLNPPEKAKSLEHDVVVETGRTIRGKVVDPEGKPARGATLNGQALTDGTFTLTNLNPRRTQELYFVDSARGLGLAMDVPADGAKPITVKLRPTGGVTGRLVDKDGQPIVNMPVTIGHVQVKTDKGGRFRADGLVVGKSYEVINLDRVRYAPFFDSIRIEPGKVKDLGDAIVKAVGE